jgi:hypothetical protein
MYEVGTEAGGIARFPPESIEAKAAVSRRAAWCSESALPVFRHLRVASALRSAICCGPGLGLEAMARDVRQRAPAG